MKRWVIGLVVISALTCGLGSPAADFDGDGVDDVTIFRPASGMWVVKDITRNYFGTGGDIPLPGDCDGDGTDDFGIFRPRVGLWIVQGVTRTYFGSEGDVPIGKGGYNPYTSQYDYVVKAGNGDDLVQALENPGTRSVFIPAGIYSVPRTIDANASRIVGESEYWTIIDFGSGADGNYLRLIQPYSCMEHIRVKGGGSRALGRGNIHVDGLYTTVRDCWAENATSHGFSYDSGADFVSLINCTAWNCQSAGFKGSTSVHTSRLSNCVAWNCREYGFLNCKNLSSCMVDGNNQTVRGFDGCEQVSACSAYDCTEGGFEYCQQLSACVVKGNGHTQHGFVLCIGVSACYANTTLSGFSGNEIDYDSCYSDVGP